MDWWRDPLAQLVAGRRAIVVGGPAEYWTPFVPVLRDVGAHDVLVVGTDGTGVGPQPEATTVVTERPVVRGDLMATVRASLLAVADPPAHIVEAVDAFDPDRSAVVFAAFLNESPTFAGRPVIAHRRPEWVALEDKTIVDALLDRAGVARAPSIVVPIERAAVARHDVDRGAGTVWAADARDGYHGGASRTRWVDDDAGALAATAALAPHCDTVRVMPFLEGVATSIHGLVLPDGVAVLRPVELVTLRRGNELVYAGCSTFWDPPTAVRADMREAAGRLGRLLRDDVDFRGAFTLDGVATAEGFRPTELNPRFGAGLNVLTRSLPTLPLLLVLDLVVAGGALPVTAAELEAELVAAADANRSGASWQLGATPTEAAERRPAAFDGEAWRWAGDDDPVDGYVTAGPGYARVELDEGRTPVGPSVGRRAAAFWRFADAELGTTVGSLVAPPDVWAGRP